MRRFLHCGGKQLRVLFFGSDEFASQHMQALLNNGISEMELVCPPSRVRRSRRRKTLLPAKQFALAHELVCHEPHPAIGFTMKGWEPPDLSLFDIGVVVSFGYRIPKRILRNIRLGIVNVHPSLLPKFRGAAPIQHAIMRDEKRTGVSIIDINVGRMDSGDLLSQREVEIGRHDTFATLSSRLANLGSEMLVDTLQKIEFYRSNRKQQCDSELMQTISESYRAPKLDKLEGLLDWNKMTAEQVILRWRSLYGFLPTFSSWRGNRILILSLDFEPVEIGHFSRFEPGQLLFCPSSQRILIGCCDGRAVACSQLQVATRKPMAALSFANGYHIAHRRRNDDGGLHIEPIQKFGS
jgi:methionyl-tRNA formyltransferase